VTKREVSIIDNIKSKLRKEGIFMYGVDTLVDDDGHRVLSEINTLSIGGWPQAQVQTGLGVEGITGYKLSQMDLLIQSAYR